MLIIVIIAPTLFQRIKCHHLASFFCGFQGAQFYNAVPLLRKEWLPEKKITLSSTQHWCTLSSAFFMGLVKCIVLVSPTAGGLSSLTEYISSSRPTSMSLLIPCSTFYHRLLEFLLKWMWTIIFPKVSKASLSLAAPCSVDPASLNPRSREGVPVSINSYFTTLILYISCHLIWHSPKSSLRNCQYKLVYIAMSLFSPRKPSSSWAGHHFR